MPRSRALALAVAALCCSINAACKDDVRFGPPGGLRAEEGGEVAACMPAEATGTPCPDWGSQIFAPLFDEGSKYGCANGNCHGPMTADAGLLLTPGDPATSYDALAAYENGGIPYISDSPDNAYILCNLVTEQDKLIGNQPMPVVGGVITSYVVDNPDDFLLIANWVQCGMPRTGMGAVSSTGVGGMGGAGGAGGTSGLGGAGM